VFRGTLLTTVTLLTARLRKSIQNKLEKDFQGLNWVNGQMCPCIVDLQSEGTNHWFWIGFEKKARHTLVHIQVMVELLLEAQNMAQTYSKEDIW